MQEYKNDKLVVRYDPAICIHAGECGARPSFCFQCVEEAVDRRERRIPGRDHRTGQALPIRRADLRTAQGRPVRPLWLSPYRRDVCRRRPRRLQASREGMLRERPKSLPAPRYILSRFLLPDIKDSQAQNLRVFFFACRRPDSEPSRSVGLRLTHFGHQRPAYGPGTDRARALYLDCCTCRSVRERGSRERREFAPDHVVKVASRRRGYGVRWINLGEEIYDATGQKRMTLPDRKVTVWV